MYRVNFYHQKELVSSKRFRSHSVAMYNAKTWVATEGYQSTVAFHSTEFAWFNRAVRLE